MTPFKPTKQTAFQKPDKGSPTYTIVPVVVNSKSLNNESHASPLALIMELSEKRAGELIIANKELNFFKAENEKTAAELTIAISDLKITQEQINEVNKELDSFSYSVSHDLRAPLRAINGYTEMLKENLASQAGTEANRLMNNILKNAKKMGMLIDDMLTFSRIGRRNLVMSSSPMYPLVQGICSELKSAASGRNIEFRIDPIPPAIADHMAINQVWENLIANAIKFTSLTDFAIIQIRSQTDGEQVIYSISDNGAGFDMRYANKLFGVFQRMHSDEEFEGNGIGLAVVHRIITNHGGRIWAEAKVNEGATFYFTLHNPHRDARR